MRKWCLALRQAYYEYRQIFPRNYRGAHPCSVNKAEHLRKHGHSHTYTPIMPYSHQ